MTKKEQQHYLHANLDELSSALISACYLGHLEDVKFLLTSPELTIHPDVHVCEDEAFKEACEGEHHAILDFLILEHHMSSTSNITYYIEYGIDDDFEGFSYAQELFLHRDKILLQKSLNSQLTEQKKEKKQSKI